MSHFNKWGALWILFVLFALSWWLQLHTQWIEFCNEASDHKQACLRSEFWPSFWKSTTENWQSEFLQLFVQAFLVASYIGQRNTFQADNSADKQDVEKILSAIKEGRS